LRYTQKEEVIDTVSFEDVLCVQRNIWLPLSLTIYFRTGRYGIDHAVDSLKDRESLCHLLTHLIQGDCQTTEFGFPNSPEAPLMSGLAKKQGSVKKSERYLSLQGHRLLVYRNESAVRSGFPLNALYLSEARLSLCGAKGIKVTCPSRKSRKGLEFYFTNVEMRNEWFNALETAVNQANTRKSPLFENIPSLLTGDSHEAAAADAVAMIAGTPRKESVAVKLDEASEPPPPPPPPPTDAEMNEAKPSVVLPAASFSGDAEPPPPVAPYTNRKEEQEKEVETGKVKRTAGLGVVPTLVPAGHGSSSLLLPPRSPGGYSDNTDSVVGSERDSDEGSSTEYESEDEDLLPPPPPPPMELYEKEIMSYPPSGLAPPIPLEEEKKTGNDENSRLSVVSTGSAKSPRTGAPQPISTTRTSTSSVPRTLLSPKVKPQNESLDVVVFVDSQMSPVGYLDFPRSDVSYALVRTRLAEEYPAGVDEDIPEGYVFMRDGAVVEREREGEVFVSEHDNAVTICSSSLLVTPAPSHGYTRGSNVIPPLTPASSPSPTDETPTQASVSVSVSSPREGNQLFSTANPSEPCSLDSSLVRISLSLEDSKEVFGYVDVADQSTYSEIRDAILQSAVRQDVPKQFVFINASTPMNRMMEKVSVPPTNTLVLRPIFKDAEWQPRARSQTAFVPSAGPTSTAPIRPKSHTVVVEPLLRGDSETSFRMADSPVIIREKEVEIEAKEEVVTAEPKRVDNKEERGDEEEGRERSVSQSTRLLSTGRLSLSESTSPLISSPRADDADTRLLAVILLDGEKEVPLGMVEIEGMLICTSPLPPRLGSICFKFCLLNSCYCPCLPSCCVFSPILTPLPPPSSSL